MEYNKGQINNFECFMNTDNSVQTWQPKADAKSKSASVSNKVDQIDTDAPLIFTAAAANKVRSLIEEEENPNLKLRVFITGGGCSGFQYGFTFDEDVNDDDFQMQKNGVTLLIDAMSMQYLEDAEIDYKEDLEGSQFVIRNPNATTTCGCGSSFSLDE